MNLLEAGLATSLDPAFEVLLGILAQRLNTPPKTRLRGFSSSRSGRRMQRGPSTPPRATGYRAHPYNISLGRPEWQSRDPIGVRGGINLYGYVENSPLNWNDPFGLCPPPDAVLYQAPNGSLFYAPPSADFPAQKAAGAANGWNIAGIKAAEGQGGTYDYQRPKNSPFNGNYTDASNFGVGVFMYGAGFSLNLTLGISDLFAFTMSKNGMLGGNPVTENFTAQGWYAAQQNQFNKYNSKCK